MPIFRVADDTANAVLDQLTERLGFGATLKFYSGRMPMSPAGAIDTETVLLGTLTFSDPAAGPAVGRTLTFSTIEEDPRAATDGDATWVRASSALGAVVFDADVGDKDRPRCVVMMNSTEFKQNGPIRVESFTIYLPA